MKRVFSTIMIMMMVISFSAIGDLKVFADDSDFTYKIVGSEVTITGYVGSGGAVVIPDQLENLPVTKIDDTTFLDNIDITEVTVSNSVKTIGEDVFSGCLLLTKAVIPDSVTAIGDGAFSGCETLTNVTLSASLTAVGLSVFNGCAALKSIVIPDKVVSIGESAFYQCTSLTSVTLGTKITAVGDMAFAGTLISGITLPATLTTIGDMSFGYTPIVKIDIPENVIVIKNGAFSGCDKLIAAIFAGNAPTIGTKIFEDCAKTFKVYYNAAKTGFTNPWAESTTTTDTFVMPTPSPTASSVKLNSPAVTMKVSSTYQLKATILPATVADKTVNWTSSNSSVATVSKSGKVTAKKVGSAVITVTTVSGSKKATCKITVTNPVTSVKLTKSISVKKGKTAKLTATVSPTNASNKKVTWKSSNTKIATVSSTGAVKGIKAGNVVITVTSVDGKKTATCKVKVS